MSHCQLNHAPWGACASRTKARPPTASQDREVGGPPHLCFAGGPSAVGLSCVVQQPGVLVLATQQVITLLLLPLPLPLLLVSPLLCGRAGSASAWQTLARRSAPWPRPQPKQANKARSRLSPAES